MNDEVPKIDWSVISEATIECLCGAVYRGKAKTAIIGGVFEIVTERPCPGCQKQVGNARSVRGDPERFSL